MLKSLLKAVGLLACMAWFNLACAANMGGINVASALGHPLKAEISLSELGKTDKSGLVAKLASVNDFKGAGIDYPYSLPKLAFEIATRANGESYIKLTSTQPVNEPFVSLLIELSWPTGKLLREYTFLLDPAGFVAEQPKMAEVKPVEPMLPAAEPVVAVIPLPAVVPEAGAVVPEAAVVAPEAADVPVPAEVAPEPVPVPAVAEAGKESAEPAVKADVEPMPVQAEMAPAEQALAEPGKVEPAEAVNVEPLAPTRQAAETTGSILVEKGDTLGKIADEVKPVDVSLERMLVAMYRANAKTFDGRNMNRIKAGKILRMPEAGEIEKITQVAAVKEIRAQVADWHAYRQKLAAAQSVVAEQAPKQEAAGKISAAVAEKAPPVKESAKEVLRLSKGESLGDKAVAGSGAKTKEAKQAAIADDEAAKSKQLLEEQKKLAKLEAIQKDASKLVELKGAAAPGAEEKKPAAEPKPAVPAPAAAPVPVSEEFDIMAMFDQYLAMVLDDPIMLGAGVVVLLGLGGSAYVFARRRSGGGQKKSRKKNEVAGEATGSWRTPVAPSPDTGDFTVSAADTSAAPMSVAAAMDDVDPISEADLFLNFGRDAQAEEILKDALSKNPSNVQIKLKLLSIYVNRKDAKTFSKYAQEIKDSGDVSAWERAAVMGREVDPSNPVYGGVKGEVRHREPAKAEVDFDLLGKAPGEAGAPAGKDFNMDFDLTATQSSVFSKPLDLSAPFASAAGVSKAKPAADVDATSILSKEVVRAAETAPPPPSASPMDFDVSGILPGEVKEIANSTTMDFDLSGSNLEFPAGSKAASSSGMMDFDLSGGEHVATAVLQEPLLSPAAASSTLSFNDLVFEIPESKAAAAPEKPKAAKDEGMAFSIDFPTSGNNGAASGKAAPGGKIDIDFGDININLEADTPPVHAGGEGKDEHWHEVATKLDLAKAYQEMGDADGAREILEEVLRDGDMAQRESAEKLMQQIAA